MKLTKIVFFVLNFLILGASLEPEERQNELSGLEKNLEGKNKRIADSQRKVKQQERNLVEERWNFLRTEKSLKNQDERIFELERQLHSNPSKVTSLLPKNCKILKENGNHATCDMDTKDGGWIVFQNRSESSLYFSRNWTEYKKGFGDIWGKEFWLGLQYLHELTEGNANELEIRLVDENKKEAFASHDNFTVDDEFGLHSIRSLGEYRSTAGDSFGYHEGAYFFRKDKDNSYDSSTRRYQDGCWHQGCLLTNLNGKYSPNRTNDGPDQGVNWFHFSASHTSLLRTKMMVRPR